MKDDKQINLQTPYEIKSPACTKKHLNTNITDTGKGNNRRWQATGGQREQRANSAGRFRHGSPKKYTSWVNPSTSLQNAVKNKVHRLHRKTPEYQHCRATIGVGKPQADSECNERIPPNGFDMAALEVPAERCGHRPLRIPKNKASRSLPANFLSDYSAISAPASHTMCADW